MNKLLAITALAALSTSAPALAQYQNSDYRNGDSNFASRISQLDARVQAGVQSGEIDRYEARTLRQQIRDLSRLERQYSRNGLSEQERQDLRQRLRALRQEVRTADSGRYDRDQRYGWNDDDYDNGYTGQGGPYEPYEEACAPRSGVGGLLDRVLNRDDGCGLRVGQRATSGLYAVPSQYRYQYRDGNGVYYRSDGRQIYQIDARSDTVVRVYPIDR